MNITATHVELDDDEARTLADAKALLVRLERELPKPEPITADDGFRYHYRNNVVGALICLNQITRENPQRLGHEW